MVAPASDSNLYPLMVAPICWVETRSLYFGNSFFRMILSLANSPVPQMIALVALKCRIVPPLFSRSSEYRAGSKR